MSGRVCVKRSGTAEKKSSSLFCNGSLRKRDFCFTRRLQYLIVFGGKIRTKFGACSLACVPLWVRVLAQRLPFLYFSPQNTKVNNQLFCRLRRLLAILDCFWRKNSYEIRRVFARVRTAVGTRPCSTLAFLVFFAPKHKS